VFELDHDAVWPEILLRLLACDELSRVLQQKFQELQRLVRTEDWKRILSARGVNTNVPAFSNLTKRVTLLDGSLVVETSARGVELRMIWQIPIEDLLDLSIRHELAHAFCNERNELELTALRLL